MGLCVEVTGCAGEEGELELCPPNQKNSGCCPRLLLPAVGTRVLFWTKIPGGVNLQEGLWLCGEKFSFIW